MIISRRAFLLFVGASGAVALAPKFTAPSLTQNYYGGNQKDVGKQDIYY